MFAQHRLIFAPTVGNINVLCRNDGRAFGVSGSSGAAVSRLRCAEQRREVPLELTDRVGSQVATTGFLQRKRHIRQARGKMAAISE